MADCFQGKNHTWELSQKFVSYKALRRSFANTFQKQCIVTFNAIYHLLPKHCNMFLQDIIIASKHEILLPNLFKWQSKWQYFHVFIPDSFLMHQAQWGRWQRRSFSFFSPWRSASSTLPTTRPLVLMVLVVLVNFSMVLVFLLTYVMNNLSFLGLTETRMGRSNIHPHHYSHQESCSLYFQF